MCVVIIIMDKQSICCEPSDKKITNDFMISCYIHLCSACIRPLNKVHILKQFILNMYFVYSLYIGSKKMLVVRLIF